MNQWEKRSLLTSFSNQFQLWSEAEEEKRTGERNYGRIPSLHRHKQPTLPGWCSPELHGVRVPLYVHKNFSFPGHAKPPYAHSPRVSPCHSQYCKRQEVGQVCECSLMTSRKNLRKIRLLMKDKILVLLHMSAEFECGRR